MANMNLSTYFVCEKIAKVRWLPEELCESDRFITGTWDGPHNFVRLWRLQNNDFLDTFNEFVPHSFTKVPFNNDITGIEFIQDNTAIISCADGRLSSLKISRAVDEDTLELTISSEVLHSFNSGDAAPCTDISLYGKEIATVGEDGRLNILDGKTFQPIRQSLEADSCALNTVAYINHKEVLTGNRMGIIRLFDVRATAEDLPVVSFMVSCEDEQRCNYVSCLCSHPTQSHVVLAGTEEGSITVWDLRQPGYPATYLSAHTSAISDMAFHHTDPKKLFTSSNNGELWMWSQRESFDFGAAKVLDLPKREDVNPWLCGDHAKNRLSVTSLISNLRKPINAFDANRSRVICGSDSEALYFIDNLF